jgi:hypothetical protein
VSVMSCTHKGGIYEKGTKGASTAHKSTGNTSSQAHGLLWVCAFFTRFSVLPVFRWVLVCSMRKPEPSFRLYISWNFTRRGRALISFSPFPQQHEYIHVSGSFFFFFKKTDARSSSCLSCKQTDAPTTCVRRDSYRSEAAGPPAAI